MTHPRRHSLIWFALAAMLAMAMLPTVSHALAFALGGSAAGAEVCTPQGLRRVAATAAKADAETAPMQPASDLDHCPLCRPAVDHPGLPPVAAQAGLPLSYGEADVPAAPHLPRMLAPWRSARPRGPPTSA
ncbi:MAG: DUF2946 family protein [Betaproteobacteria bacterium]|nr:DUF2946 family protein [Betaproteobacteria bacterium]